MKWLFLVYCAAAAALATPKHTPRTDPLAPQSPVGAEPSGADALYALVRRRLPAAYHESFEFTIDPAAAVKGEHDSWRVTPGAKVCITATSTSGLARGLLEHLRSRGGDIFWSGDTFGALAGEPVPLSGGAWARLRYFLNVCTWSYSTAFYHWERWEYLLDWAALHGFNMPLASGGQE
jgi:alpha-N-acetylglucosaminidase